RVGGGAGPVVLPVLHGRRVRRRGAGRVPGRAQVRPRAGRLRPAQGGRRGDRRGGGRRVGLDRVGGPRQRLRVRRRPPGDRGGGRRRGVRGVLGRPGDVHVRVPHQLEPGRGQQLAHEDGRAAARRRDERGVHERVRRGDARGPPWAGGQL